MHPSPLALSSLPTQHRSSSEISRKEDHLYKVITVAAMVGMLATLWVF